MSTALIPAFAGGNQLLAYLSVNTLSSGHILNTRYAATHDYYGAGGSGGVCRRFSVDPACRDTLQRGRNSP
ncbi:MAG TPA: hypothetical protein VFA28_08260 [Bryobacteraceae bacterium]|nr:hypothetical protein [Bryobacteraceae bacterium]